MYLRLVALLSLREMSFCPHDPVRLECNIASEVNLRVRSSQTMKRSNVRDLTSEQLVKRDAPNECGCDPLLDS